MTTKVKITKRFVDRVTLPPEKAGLPRSQAYIFYWDADLPGFGLKVTSTTKNYVVQTRIAGKTSRTAIGKHGVFTPDEARNKARIALGKMSDGVNLNNEKRRQSASVVTLGELVEVYLKKRKKLSKTSIRDYRKIVGLLPPPKKLCLGKRSAALYVRDWKDKPIVEISKEMIERRHSLIGETSPASANLVMRMMRALFNFAEEEYQTPEGDPLVPVNPVKRLSKQRAWYADKSRKSYIKPEQLPTWWRAVADMKSEHPQADYEMNKDYVRLILLTGLRLNEAASLRADDLDMKAKVFIVRDTKNNQDHALPITDYLYQLFARRLAEVKARGSDFVFPGEGESGHMSGAKDFVLALREKAGFKFTLHDLRRTFATTAESLDISPYAVKKLLNHKMPGDVTFVHYLIIEAERLREPMQKITDHVLRVVGERKNVERREQLASESTIA
jgi:integrase